jgi:hypothetical protein
LVFPAPQQQQEKGMALLVFPCSAAGKTKGKAANKTLLLLFIPFPKPFIKRLREGYKTKPILTY